MARIRTIKPEFFRHEELYAAEIQSRLPLRVAFAGLFTVADREGRFKWKPTQIKFDVLPYDDLDFAHVLNALAAYGFIVKYEVDGKTYGAIPSFKDHQVINNKEAKSLIPEKTDAPFTRLLHVTHASLMEGKEGKGREGNIQRVCEAVAGIFGRDFEEDPEERMPDLHPWYTEITFQSQKLLNAYGEEKAVQQVKAYIKHCKETKRKLIGLPYKVAETIMQSDWMNLTGTTSDSPRGSPYQEAAYNKTLWTEEAWYEYYFKHIQTDPGFREYFQITQHEKLRSRQPVGINAQR